MFINKQYFPGMYIWSTQCNQTCSQLTQNQFEQKPKVGLWGSIHKAPFLAEAIGSWWMLGVERHFFLQGYRRITMKENRGYDFKREQGGIYGRDLREQRDEKMM